MKSLIKISIAIIVINATMLFAPQKITAQEVSVGFQVFYDDLSPYGTWVDNPQYGYVWLPSVEVGFTPYGSNGYWTLTDAGWTCVSNYPWGWAPFHYGRWYTDPMYGPLWVPGEEWGPGWVTWRQSEGYYGWAPIRPGISIDIAYSNSYNVPNDNWVFVRDRDFGRTDIHNHYVDRSTNVTIIKNTTVINNTYVEGGRKVSYNAGPKRAEVEKRAGKTFAPVAIKENSKHGESVGNGGLQLYRPQIKKNNTATKKEAPAKVVKMQDLKAPAKQESKAKNQEPVQQKNPAQEKKSAPAAKQEPTKTKQKQEPAKQQPIAPKSTNQPNKEQPKQPQQRNEPIPPKNNNPQNREQPKPQQRNEPVPPKNNNPQNSQMPPPPQPKAEPVRPQPMPPANNNPQNKQQPSQPQPRNNPPPRQEAPRQQAPHQEVPHQEAPRQQVPHQEGAISTKPESEENTPHSFY